MKPYTIEDMVAIREAADAISRIASTGIGMQIQGAAADALEQAGVTNFTVSL